jgi:DNA adenine methylase
MVREYSSAAMPAERLPCPLKPPLKWAGGKRWLVPHLRSIWAAYSERRLVEPFCGGLAVTLSFLPQRALLNDGNPHLINFYRWLARGLNLELPMENNERQFYAHRQQFNELLRTGREESREAAALFYYLNRTGFNGLCRFNRSGEFNVPFGRYARINYRRDFSAYAGVLERWEFRSGDFEKVPLAPDDFVYADPPYDVQFTQYAKEAFGWEEQERAAVWLAQHPGPVVLSNQGTDRIIALYRKLGFKLSLVDAPRRISCTGDRTPAQEVIASRNLETAALNPCRPTEGEPLAFPRPAGVCWKGV